MLVEDILTVMWKERKELFTERDTLRGRLAAFFGPLVMVAALGVVAPWQVGPDWLKAPFSVVAALFVSLMFGGMTAGSIAGERERHTLETLLASRLPDRAILFGKVAIAVCFASASALATVLLGMVTVNMLHWDGGLQLCPLSVVLADILVSVLAATLSAALGVFVSLKAATVRQAEQNIMGLLAGGSMILTWVPILLLKTVPGLEARFAEMLTKLDATHVILVLLSALTVADAGFLLAAMHRFKRARLIVP